jgi:hypothetical protein
MSHAERPRTTSPRWGTVGILIVLIYVVGAGMSVWFETNISTYPPEDPLWRSLAMLLGFGWFAVVGGFLVARRPHYVMGWLLAAVPLLLGVLSSAHSYAAYQILEAGREPTLALSLLAWPNNWYWYLTLSIFFLYIPLIFPTGRLPSRRWRIVAWVGSVGVVGVCSLGAISGEIGLQVSQTAAGPAETIPNPLGVAGVVHVEQLPVMEIFGAVLLASMLGALASLVVRFRGSGGVERQQIKWLALAFTFLPLSLGLEMLGAQLTEQLQGIGFLAGLNAIPLAIGLAVLRYRLYDIDRIISRTLAYVLLTAVLAAVYVGGVLGLGAVLNAAGSGGGDLVVAASTLAVAALFQPVRRRLQSLVDRRFNRARYDSEQVVGAFVQRLRDEVRIETLTADVRDVLTATVHPAFVGVWTPERAP